MKPGLKTSEFWLGLAVAIMGAVAAVYADNAAAQVAGIVSGSLIAAGYGLARSNAKARVEAAELDVHKEGTPLVREREHRAARYSMGGGEEGRARVRTLVAIAALGLVCLGCVGPREAWVKADRATYDAVAPAHEAYIDADETLTEAQKQGRRDLLESWAIRLEVAEQVIEGDK